MVLIVDGIELEVRDATRADVPVLLSMIRSMAAFEKLAVTTTEASLEAALFGDTPSARALLASVESKPVGYVTYYLTFASMSHRRALWLDDLFVDAAFRGRGIGRALMAYLADLAIRNDCDRFEWMVLDWNEAAIGFYRRLGARLLDQWRVCRMTADQLPGVARGLSVAGSPVRPSADSPE